MSELIHEQNDCRMVRGRLLTTVSAAALLLATIEATGAAAESNFASSERPTVWIELGGEVDQIGGGLDPYVPRFTQLSDSLTSGSSAPIIQKAPIFSYGGEGKLSYEPEGTDWVFSASVRYGRAIRHKLAHEQTAGKKYPPVGAFYDAGATTSEGRVIADFQAGKDVGLGVLGEHARSVFSVGLRYAQFTAHSSGFISSAKTVYDHYFYKEKNEYRS